MAPASVGPIVGQAGRVWQDIDITCVSDPTRGDMFRLLTAAPVQSSTDLPRAVRETVLAHDLPKSLNALKPPTATP
jgi:hypothetical protein